MKYIDFINKLKKVNETRVHKIKNSWGVYDYYKYYRKNKPKDKKFILTESQYFHLIREINKRLIEVLFRDGMLKFPCEMGLLILEKFDIYPRIDSKGNLFYPAPIDWGETLKLWSEDEEAFEYKIKIKKELKYAYKIIYRKTKATYNNRSFYNISFNREMKKLLNQRDKEGKINICFKNRKPILN